MHARNAQILLVDDELDSREWMRRTLRQEGYELREASCGADAVALIEKYAIDCVVSDQRMPKMNGLELLERARIVRPDSVRLLLTGHAEAGPQYSCHCNRTR